MSVNTVEGNIMSASVFEEQGIQFKVITPDMYEDVMDFLWTHLFPSEPISRSLGLKRLGFLDKYVFPDAFRQNLSMVALDRSDNILAVRVGHIKTRDDWAAWMMDRVFQAEFSPLIGRASTRLGSHWLYRDHIIHSVVTRALKTQDTKANFFAYGVPLWHIGSREASKQGKG